MSEITFNPVPTKLFKKSTMSSSSSSEQISMKPRCESKLFGTPEKSTTPYMPRTSNFNKNNNTSQETLFTPNISSSSLSTSTSSPRTSTSSPQSSPWSSQPSSLTSSLSILHPRQNVHEQLDSQSQFKSSITIHNIRSDLHKNTALRNEDYPLTLSIHELIVEIGRRFCMPLTVNEITGASNISCFEKLQIQFEKIYPEWIEKMNLINKFVEDTETSYNKSNYLDLKKKLALQIMNISISLIMLGPDAIHSCGFEDSVVRNSEKFVTSLSLIDDDSIVELSYLFTLLQLCTLFQPIKDAPDMTRPEQFVASRLLDVIPEKDTILSNLVQEKISSEKNPSSGFSSSLDISDFQTSLCDIIYEKMSKNSPYNIKKIFYKTNISVLKDSKQIFNLDTSQLREIKKNLLSIIPVKEKINNFITNFTYGLDDIYYYKMVTKKKEFTHTTLLNEKERLINTQASIKKNINKFDALIKNSKNITANTEELVKNKKELELNVKNIDNIATKIKNIIDIINECKNKINLILSMIFDTIDFSYFVHDDYLTELDWGLCDNKFFDS